MIEADIALKALDHSADKGEQTLDAYVGFTNMIDDYFEYRCRSEEDQKFVHDALGALTKRLSEIQSIKLDTGC